MTKLKPKKQPKLKQSLVRVDKAAEEVWYETVIYVLFFVSGLARDRYPISFSCPRCYLCILCYSYCVDDVLYAYDVCFF